MYILKLIKGKSYTGAVRATEARPLVEVEEKGLADALIQSGYFALHSESKPASSDSTPPGADVPLAKRTIDQLKAYAADNGIDLGAATRKDDILAAIEKAEATPDDNDDPTGSFVGGPDDGASGTGSEGNGEGNSGDDASQE